MRTPSTALRLVAIGALVGAGAVVPLGVAGAADYPSGGTPPEVSPNQVSNPGPAVAAKTAARSTLPFTGSDAVELTAIAGASAGIGLVLVRRSRRNATA